MRYAVLGYAAVALCCAIGCNNTTLGGGDNLDGGPEPDLTPVGVLNVEPSPLQTITVAAGQMTPSVVYTATWDGQPIAVNWSLDRGDIGSIPAGPAETETFVPRGTTGGIVTIRAAANGQQVRRQVQVLLTAQQNGANPAAPGEAAQIPASVADLTSGGGVGGVGGEGLGPAVTNAAVLSALKSPTSTAAAAGLTMLYPYDATVFPRGILAPLLMWRWPTNDADAVQIELSTTSGSFKWTGTFGRPAILTTTGGKFIRHPIPQDVWKMATDTAGGLTPEGNPDKLTIKVTIAKGTTGYGPMTQTWTVAPGRLAGIIYYQSYGTLLAKNLGGAVGGDKMFGGAVLSIHVGDTGPKLTAGANGAEAQCRTCHSVAANGSRLVVQHGDMYGVSSAYTLTPTGATETTMTNGTQFPAIYPDGSMALTAGGSLLPLPGGGNALSVSGLSTVSASLGTPSFSPNGSLVAFNPMDNLIPNATRKLVVMSFNSTNRTFSNPITVVDDSSNGAAEVRPGWPAVFPDGQSVVFHHQSVAGFDGNGMGQMATRKGAKAQIAWTNVTDSTKVTPLNQLNGKDASGNVYLPKLTTAVTLSCDADGKAVGGLDNDHGDDVNLNYEPTVNPVATGGYVWVVFTSRRMYGNLATIPPYCSDPRGVDLVQNITTKKLWVAAIDVAAKPGSDASHPSFYLPAQELLAGNSRGFWTLDPCKANGASCESGDQCCNGFCQPNASTGALECSSGSSNQCSAVQERCTTVADCCDSSNLCINNFCTQHTIG